jgi:hypothetical protein
MHSYASDAKDGYTALGILALASVGCAYALGYALDYFKVAVPWWLDAPSILGFYGLLFGVYNRVAWRWSICGFQFSGVPDVGGTWYGEITSNYAGETQSEGMIFIAQTWSKITVCFENASSRSYSRMASLNVTPGVNEGLIYEYANDPATDARTTMHGHRGLSFMRLGQEGKTLAGEYFTGRDRGTSGRIALRRLSKARMDFEAAKTSYHKEQK